MSTQLASPDVIVETEEAAIEGARANDEKLRDFLLNHVVAGKVR
jgi:hypothetical protein